MKLLMIIFICAVLYLLYRNYKPKVITLKVSDTSSSSDHSLTIREKLQKDRFVKPQHNLLYIFNEMSAKDKVVLDGDCQTNIYTRDTIPANKNEYIIEMISIILRHVKDIDNKQDYYLKDIDQLYVQMDKYENKRYIVVAFIYDIRNYYTLKIAIDFVRRSGEDQVYVNSIGNQFSSNYDIMNRYDYSIFSHGYLRNYNMYEKDARAILDENYKKYFRLIGINDSSLEYYRLHNTYRINKENITKYDLDDYNKYYYPPGLPNTDSSAFCEKHLNDWSTHGVKFENPHAPKNCIANNNAARVISTTPYDGPGVVTQRVDENKYEWMNEATRGNLIRTSGYKF